MVVNAKPVALNKRTLKQVFHEAASSEKKLAFQGGDNLRPDSRYAIGEISEDHVTFRLLGDELLIVPYTAIASLRVGTTSLTIRYK